VFREKKFMAFNFSLCKVRLKKLATSLLHPSCWPALAFGVAPSVEHIPVIRSLKVDGIIDAGANRGQFTLACRLAMPGVPIVAFEPIPAEAAIFEKIHGRVQRIVLVKAALGEFCGVATLHLSRSADSSSLLPIGKQQKKLFSNTDEVGLLDVPVCRLDDHLSKWSGLKSQLLKIDVQGFELFVLRGGVETLSTCKYVYSEVSSVQLYEGQSLRHEVTNFLVDHGFVEDGQFNCLVVNNQLIQLDLLYKRKSCEFSED